MSCSTAHLDGSGEAEKTTSQRGTKGLPHPPEGLQAAERRHAALLETYGSTHPKLGASALALGRLCYAHHLRPQALGHLLEALRIAEGLKDEALRLEVLLALGPLYRQSGDYERALTVTTTALERSYLTGQLEGAAEAHNTLGNVYQHLYAYSEALEHYLRSVALYEGLGHDTLAKPLNNIGIIYEELGDYDEALRYYERSLEADRRHDNRPGEATTLGNIGDMYAKRGDIRRAFSYLERSRALLEAEGDPYTLGYILTFMAEVCLQQHDLAGATALYERTQALLQSYPERQLEARTLRGLGQVQLESDAAPASIALFEAALACLPEGHKRERSETHALLSHAYRLSGALEGALEHLSLSYALKEEVQTERMSQRLRSLMIQANVERQGREGEIYRLKHVELVEANRKLTALNAQLEKQARKLEKLSSEDGLTGLYNRRHFDKHLRAETSRARRSGSPLSLCLCDVDHFKRINDRYSHAVGDAVLRSLGQLLKRHTRRSDIVARYGGEEFVLLLPDTGLEAAVIACEKLRLAVANHPWSKLHPEMQVTLSMGLVSLDPPDTEALLREADRLLYGAKDDGRNRLLY